MSEYNNDAEGIMELPLTPEEIGVLRDIYSKFVVEVEAQDVSWPEAFSVIIGINPKVSHRWVLKNFINIDEFKIIKDGGMIRFVFDEDEEVSSSNNDKGGEKVKKDYSCKLSPGEKKFAKTLYSKWTEKQISNGHKDTLCKIGKCKERALKTLTKRGFLEEKGDYYKIIPERFEEL